jgi:hypothetical protein
MSHTVSNRDRRVNCDSKHQDATSRYRLVVLLQELHSQQSQPILETIGCQTAMLAGEDGPKLPVSNTVSRYAARDR